MKDNKQKIGCDVESCSYNDKDKKCCELREIEIKKQSGCDECTCVSETVCSNYENKDEE